MGVNLPEILLELAPHSLTASASATTLWQNTQMGLNDGDYDGATYYFEIVATNGNAGAAYDVSLVKYSDSSVIATATIPAGTNAALRIRSASFVPIEGNEIYAVLTPQTASAGQVIVYTARIVVSQANATKTRVQVCMFFADVPSATPIKDQINSVSYGQQNAMAFARYVKDSSYLADIAAGSPWSFEAVIQTNSTIRTVTAGLVNITDGTTVQELSHTGDSNLFYASADFADNAANFHEGDEFEVKHHGSSATYAVFLCRAAIYVKLENLSKITIYDLLCGRSASTVTITYLPYHRTKLALNGATGNCYAEACGYEGAAGDVALRLTDEGSSDSSAAGSDVADSLMNFGGAKSRVRSAAITLTEATRYIGRVNRSDASTLYVGVGFIILPLSVSTPNIDASLSDSIPTPQDAIGFTLQGARYASVSDTLGIISDSLYPIPVPTNSFSGSVSDRLKVIIDAIAAIKNANIAASVSDTLLPIKDEINSGKVTVAGALASRRWVAPVSITPRTDTIDPIHLAAHPVRHPDAYFAPRIKSYGIFTRAISAPVEFVRTGDASLSILDPDNTIRQSIAAKTIMKAKAEVRLGPEGGSLAAFLRPLSRQITGVTQPSDGMLEIGLQDYFSTYLDQSIPPLITLENFANLPEASAGEFAPIVFGHVSCQTVKMLAYRAGGGIFTFLLYKIINSQYADPDGGAIKAILVDRSAYKYLVARHKCRSVEVWRKTSSDDKFKIVPPYYYNRVNEVVASGETVEEIQFTSDQGDAEIRVNVDGIFDESRYEFAGFFGRAGSYIETIGIMWYDKEEKVYGEGEEAGRQDGEGTPFEDTAIPAGAHISAIRIWEGTYIDAVQIVYTLSDGSIQYGTKHGGSGGTMIEFVLIDGEYVTGISGMFGDVIDSLTITTNLVSAQYGGPGGSTPYELYVSQSIGLNFPDAIMQLLVGYLGIEKSLEYINLSSFEQTRSRTLDLVCCGAFTRPISWAEALSQLQRSSNIDLFTDKNNRIKIHYTTDSDMPTVNLDDVLRLFRGTVRQSLADPTCNQIPYLYAPNYAADKWTQEVYDNEEDQEALDEIIASDPVQLYFVRDAETALAVVERRAQYLDLDAFRFEGTVPLIPVLEELELADLVEITHSGGIKAGGYVGEQFKILELSMDIDNLRYQFKGIRRKLPPPEKVEEVLTGYGAINSRMGPHYNSVEGELFGLFIDVDNPKKLVLWYTNDYGATWAKADDAAAPVLANSIISFDSVISGGIIHSVTQEETTGRVSYHAFSATTRLWTVTNSQVVASVLNLGRHCVSIDCRYPLGEPVIFFQGDRESVGGVFWQRGYYSILQSGVWSVPVMATLDPGPQSIWGTDSTNCYVERIVSGRENRMHFFYSETVSDDVRRASGGEWHRTMQADLSFSSFLCWCSGVDDTTFPGGWANFHGGTGWLYYAASRDIGNPRLSAARDKIFVPRKGWYGVPIIDVYAEGSTLQHLRTQYIETDVILYEGLTPYFETDNPAAFVSEQNGILYAGFATDTRKQVSFTQSTDDGAVWSTPLQASPTHSSPQIQVLDGQIIKVRGVLYMTYFSGPWDTEAIDGPIFRWLRVDKLPYVEY